MMEKWHRFPDYQLLPLFTTITKIICINGLYVSHGIMWVFYFLRLFPFLYKISVIQNQNNIWIKNGY